MSKVVFLSLPAFGHTNPTLGVVKELTRRGVQVIYYSTERFREALERVGAEFRAYRCSSDLDMTSRGKGNRSTEEAIIEELPCFWEIADNHLEEIRAEQPGCIVYDSVAMWSYYIVSELQIPSVCSLTTFGMNSGVIGDILKVSSLKDKLASVRLILTLTFLNKKQRELVKRLSSGRYSQLMKLFNSLVEIGDKKMVFTSREMQPHSDNFDATYYFIGPSIIDRNEPFELPEDERPLIYISIGTVESNPHFFQTAFQAFGDGRYRVLLSIGKGSTVESLGEIPANFTVKNYVPQLEVLKKASLFVTHCGMNSAHESLYSGVPIIGLPQTGEQSLVAKRVADRGAGIFLRRMTAPKLRAAAETILADSSYRENCLVLKKEFREAGGATAAADLIMKSAGLVTAHCAGTF